MLNMINYLFKLLFTVSLLSSGDRRQSRLAPAGASGSARRRSLTWRLRVLLNHVAGIHDRSECEFSWKGIRLQTSSNCLSWRSPDISGVQILLERVGCEMRRTHPAQLLCVVGVNCARRILLSHFFNKSGRLIGKEWKE